MAGSGQAFGELDCRGLSCPEPVLRTRAALAELPAGAELLVIATDPLAELDLTVFCRQTGHQLVAVDSRDGESRIRIRVRPGHRPGAG